jgi:hypothetical protein
LIPKLPVAPQWAGGRRKDTHFCRFSYHQWIFEGYSVDVVVIIACDGSPENSMARASPRVERKMIPSRIAA